MQPFYKNVPHIPSEYFCTNNERNLPEIQDKNIICLVFYHSKESYSSKKMQFGY